MKLTGCPVKSSFTSANVLEVLPEIVDVLWIGAISETKYGEKHVIQASGRQTLSQKTFPEFNRILRELALSSCRDCKNNNSVF
jgi:hypothetical protein